MKIPNDETNQDAISAPPVDAQEAPEGQESVNGADEKEKARTRRFCAICPPIYRQSDISRFPEPLRRLCSGPFPGGVGIIGPTNRCKTRAAWMLVRRAMLELRRRCYGINSVDFCIASGSQFSDDWKVKENSTQALRNCRAAEVLLLDDVGKGRITDRAEMELYGMLEHRTSHGLVTIWTGNARGCDLLSMFTEDRGHPILRRLGEFSTEIVDLFP